MKVTYCSTVSDEIALQGNGGIAIFRNGTFNCLSIFQYRDTLTIGQCYDTASGGNIFGCRWRGVETHIRATTRCMALSMPGISRSCRSTYVKAFLSSLSKPLPSVHVEAQTSPVSSSAVIPVICPSPDCPSTVWACPDGKSNARTDPSKEPVKNVGSGLAKSVEAVTAFVGPYNCG